MAICCLQNDISVRLIGTLSLLVYSVALAACLSNYPQPLTKNFWKFLLGVDLQIFHHNLESKLEGEVRQIPEGYRHPITRQMFSYAFTDFTTWVSVSYKVLLVVLSLSSALLTWSSITLNRKLTIPWIISKCMHTILQIATFSVYLASEDDNKWTVLGELLNFAISLYFITVVIVVQKDWNKESNEISRLNLSACEHHESWENIARSPPRVISPYKYQV